MSIGIPVGKGSRDIEGSKRYTVVLESLGIGLPIDGKIGCNG